MAATGPLPARLHRSGAPPLQEAPQHLAGRWARAWRPPPEALPPALRGGQQSVWCNDESGPSRRQNNSSILLRALGASCFRCQRLSC